MPNGTRASRLSRDDGWWLDNSERLPNIISGSIMIGLDGGGDERREGSSTVVASEGLTCCVIAEYHTGAQRRELHRAASQRSAEMDCEFAWLADQLGESSSRGM